MPGRKPIKTFKYLFFDVILTKSGNLGKEKMDMKIYF